MPGTVYTLTEDVPPGWTSPGVICDVDELDPDAPRLQFRTEPAQSISCDVAHAADQASLSFVKSVDGVADDRDWSFPVMLDPPAGGVGSQDASGTGNTPSVPLEWTGLVPGRQHELTEATGGYDAGVLSCDVDGEPIDLGLPFTPEPGDQISCAVTNTAQPPGRARRRARLVRRPNLTPTLPPRGAAGRRPGRAAPGDRPWRVGRGPGRRCRAPALRHRAGAGTPPPRLTGGRSARH